MNPLGLIITGLLLAGMFILLRRIERWLHQHIFKVGWLLTQNYQTTTILYYTFFLPGVVLHEVILWLAAGAFNVRSERSIKWPEAQEVGELKLNFVQLTGRSHPYRRAIIAILPTLFGIVSVWLIANNIFDIMAVVATMSTGELTDVAAGFSQLTAAPLFWLWVYIIFCIANTMYPAVPRDLRGWRTILLGAGALIAAITLVGLGAEIFEAISAPLSQIINVLLATFVLIICIDILVVLVLGLIEYTIERITGNSATFRRGKMITMTRTEALEERRKQRERAQRRVQRQRQTMQTVFNSVYDLAFSIPGAPGEEPITQLQDTLTTSAQPTTRSLFDDDTDSEAAQTIAPARDDLAARISFPQQQPPPPPEMETVEPEEPLRRSVSDKSAESAKESATEADEAVEIARSSMSSPQPRSTSDDSRETADKPDQTIDVEKSSVQQLIQRAPDKTTQDDKTDIESSQTQSQSRPLSRFSTRSKQDDITGESTTDNSKPTARPLSSFGKDTAQNDDSAQSETTAIDINNAEASTPDTVTSGEQSAPSTLEKQSGAERSSTAIERSTDDFANDEADSSSEVIMPAVSRFQPKQTSKPATDDNTSDAPSRFGIRPFGAAGNNNDENTKPADTAASQQRKSPPSRLGAPTFRRSDDDDEGTADDPHAEARRARAKDATADLFKGLNVDKPSIGTDSVEEDDTPAADVSGLGKPRPFTRSTRFGSSRPAPKPFSTSSFDEEEDDKGLDEDVDDIVYEDIDEYVDYEDDDDIIDYVDDDD